VNQRRLNLPLLSQRHEARLHTVFRAAELHNLRLLARMRTGAVSAVALWLIFISRGPRLAENLLSCALFAALGWGYYALIRRHPAQPWYAVLFPLVDALVLIENLVPIMPWNAHGLPPPVPLRYGSFVYLFLPLAFAAFFYSPWRTLWSAVVMALAWGAAVGWALLQPGTFVHLHLSQLLPADPGQFVAIYLDPGFVDIGAFGNEVFVLLLTGTLLSIVVWRTREVVLRQAVAERNRSNLARYFSPNIVDELEAMDNPLARVRTQPVAVLFADIVGFTRLSEHLPPERVIELLRSFDRRMAQTVFAHHGTLDKYIGDAVMATFGVPHTGKEDAFNALRCARAMIDELARWNDKRRARGAEPVRAGIGVHFGPAVLGDIGDERRLEYAVIGDTVNVASRIERLTRVLGVDILVSHDLVEAAQRQAPEQAAGVLASFEQGRPRTLRGRVGPVALWSYRATALTLAPAERGEPTRAG
jgi:adenylate cyclase